MNQNSNNAMQTPKLILGGFGLLALGLSGCVSNPTDPDYDSGYKSGATSRSSGSYSSSATHAGGIPLLNVSCTDKYEVHADQGGPVFINGKETRLKKVNDNYYEATGSGITVSIAINPDGSPNVSYTGQHGINGVCQAAQSGASGRESRSSGGSSASSAPMAPGDMADYCRGEAAGQFATKPAYINTGKPTRVKGEGYAVKGTADLGNQGRKPFQCDFDQSGRFLHFKSLVDEGRL